MLANDIPGFDQLSALEKLRLVEDLWDRIAEDESSLPVPPSHMRELEIRLQKLADHPEDLISLEEFQARLRRPK